MNSAPAGTAEKNAERTIVLSHFSGTERKKMKPISECAARKNGECRRIFTLIELLIVIAVIAILTGLLLPALQSAKRKVYTTSCVSSMKQIGQAIYLYIGDNDDYPPAPREWANYMLNGNYIPKKNSTKLYGTLAVFKIRHLMICPMFSSVTDSALWPADQAPMEWSVTTYTPPVGYHDWDAEFDTYGWGYENRTKPRAKIHRFISNAAFLGEMAYKSNNTNHYNTTDAFMNYMTIKSFINHGEYTTNVLFTAGNVRTLRFMPGYAPYRNDFTLKQQQ